MNLKKKVIFGMVAGFFALATVFNMSMLNETGAGDVSLDAISVMAEAQTAESDTTDIGHWQYDDFLDDDVCVGDGKEC